MFHYWNGFIFAITGKWDCFCPPPPLWVIVRRRKLDEERREREQRELNEQTKQGNMVNNENREMTLPETVVVLMSFVALLCFLKEDYEK